MVPVLIGLALITLYFVISSGAVAEVEGIQPVTCCNITNDPATWPSGDRVWNVCRAIAVAEGANVAGSNPDRLNNPGDISDGSATYGFEAHSGSAVTKFPDKQTGWQWLYNKINNAFVLGQSAVYSPDMTWTGFAQKYAGDWQDWVTNVTGPLNVSPDDRVGDYFSA
jgi:hypothetical protein